MTIKDLINTIPEDIKISIAWNGGIIPANIHNPLIMDAMSDYVIDTIVPVSGSELEINIKSEPVKAR